MGQSSNWSPNKVYTERFGIAPRTLLGFDGATTPRRRFGHERLRQRGEVAPTNWGLLEACGVVVVRRGKVAQWRNSWGPRVCFPAKAQAFGLYGQVHGERLRAKWQRDTCREKGGSNTG
jgi:hypothetical protein